MNSIQEYFHTDWAAMTFHDWVGLTITVVVFLSMVIVYAYVLNPANKEQFESRRYMPLEEERLSLEDQQ
ncbi:MAG: cbb3-type cytochrome c oxidase subunit 3 [Gammaproteobacteria bacterium]|nr:cbb3-type cytochrome c oxidase subunit 3 [Gammaproteobacteria bacterium]MDH5729311.1 cbb3-type cytochrome c oxidase subunit 3 [Gammaproteobacteria bacterium]